MIVFSVRTAARTALCAIALHTALALPAAAAPGAAAPALPAPAPRSECPEATGIRILLRPIVKARCVVTGRLGAGQRPSDDAPAATGPEVAAASISEAAVTHERHPCVAGAVAGAEVPDLVASIFRCRLREAGWPEDGVAYSTAEALTVAACESNFDTSAVVFDGRYRDVPHPNGNRYSAAGVFQFIRSTAERWIDGGYAAVHDPASNIDAAARLYIHNIRSGVPGWSDWACAAANDGFASRSVLPGWPGGPAQLPEWAFSY